MAWIDIIPPNRANARLRAVYDRVAGPDGQVDNILQLHSLRPHTLEGHMALYKSVLHHSSNDLPEWFLEATGVYVSIINRCDYCVQHHMHGMARLLADDQRADQLGAALHGREPERVFQQPFSGLLDYAARLTEDPASLTEADIEQLRSQGASDAAILEVNQVAAYFAYANRTVLGLGATTAGEELGLAPRASDNPEDWSHS